jgi:hypothetical protein
MLYACTKCFIQKPQEYKVLHLIVVTYAQIQDVVSLSGRATLFKKLSQISDKHNQSLGRPLNARFSRRVSFKNIHMRQPGSSWAIRKNHVLLP